MPTYDFQCQKCGHVFEELLPMGSKSVPACPACKSKRTEKLISPPAVHFHGEGFYKTDSAPAKKSSADATTAEISPKTTAPKEETKKASKPAAQE